MKQKNIQSRHKFVRTTKIIESLKKVHIKMINHSMKKCV